MSTEETVGLAKAIVKYGGKLKLNKGKKIILDKHCSGGVPGNRTTMVVAPIVAAAGLLMPKTSSRSITSPAGTADTMEVLAPVSFPVKKMQQIVDKVGVHSATGKNTYRSVEPMGGVTGIFECFNSAFQEMAMLWIGYCCIFGRQTEITSVEHFDFGQATTDGNVFGVTDLTLGNTVLDEFILFQLD